MREIKFRAKAKFSGTIGSDKWLYSSLMRLDAPTHRLNLAGQECDIETLGQFTGLHDKNGKEIYEGDILRHGHGDCKGAIVQVIYQAPEFIMKENPKHKTWYTFILAPSENQFEEVVGNIHEETK